MFVDLVVICILWGFARKVFTYNINDNKKRFTRERLGYIRCPDASEKYTVDKRHDGNVLVKTYRGGGVMDDVHGEWRPHLGCPACGTIFGCDVPSRSRYHSMPGNYYGALFNTLCNLIF